MNIRCAAGITALAVLASSASAHIYVYAFGMSSRWVVPESDSNAIAGGLLEYNHHTFNYDLEMTVQGLTLDDLADTGPNGTPIHAYMAPRGENGDIAIDFGREAEFEEIDGGLRLSIDGARLGGDQGAFETNIFAVENALYDGDLYIQLYTNDHPDGAIRGQFARFGKNLFSEPWNGSDFAQHSGFSQIPAPGAIAMLFIGGGVALRRRR